MDSSYWANLNSKVKFEVTKKQYYGRYLWRLVYNIKKINLANDKHVPDVSAYVKAKREDARLLASSVYVHLSRRDEWVGVDVQLIERVRTVMQTFKDVVKFRTEWHTMQIYAETEEDLKKVCAAIDHDSDIVAVTGPLAGTEDALCSGHVFMADIGYKYKIILRDGNYDQETKQRIYNQLIQRDDIKMPASLIRELRKKYPALWGAYLYANDDSVVTVLSLIAPGLVGKIHPIDQLQ
jgi:hypothetical protein